MVTPANLKQVIGVWNTTNIIDFKIEAYNYMQEKDGRCKCVEFCSHLIGMFRKLPDRDMTQSYQTQAIQLQVMLKEM